MVPEPSHDELARLWQNQGLQEGRMSLQDVRARARAMERASRWRNGSEYLAGIIVLFVVVWAFPTLPNVVLQIGAAMMVLTVLYLAYAVHRRGSVRRLPVDLGTTDSVAFHRTELIRQRDALRSVNRWYLLPFVPSIATMSVGGFIERPERWLFTAGFVVIWIATHVTILGLNHRVARRVEGEISALDQI